MTTKNGKDLEKAKLWDYSQESAVLVKRDQLTSSNLTVTFAIYVERKVAIPNYCSDISSLEYNITDCVYSNRFRFYFCLLMSGLVVEHINGFEQHRTLCNRDVSNICTEAVPDQSRCF